MTVTFKFLHVTCRVSLLQLPISFGVPRLKKKPMTTRPVEDLLVYCLCLCCSWWSCACSHPTYCGGMLVRCLGRRGDIHGASRAVRQALPRIHRQHFRLSPSSHTASPLHSPFSGWVPQSLVLLTELTECLALCPTIEMTRDCSAEGFSSLLLSEEDLIYWMSFRWHQ